MRLVAGSAVAGQPFTVGAELVAQGDENAVGFSLRFDAARLEYVDAVATAGGFSLLVNRNQAAEGRVGFALSRGAGSAFPAGAARLLSLHFRAREVTGSTALAFTDSPIIAETVGLQAQVLPAVYQGLALEVLPLVAPSIVTQPEGGTVYAGTNVTLRVVAAGSEPLLYQWEYAQQVIVGATNATLELAAIREDQAGDYRVLISNGGGVATSETVNLTVLPALSPPAIERQPEPALASAGETVTFSVTASGSEPLLYQWQRQNTDLPGQTSATLVLEDVQVAQAGNYRVIVRNPIGTVTSQ
ncbi:MAG: immunoglobulin domain-containing protein, partial [Verrucomicrobiae bacterium]|nr:immunoglobulin domain-containing protein [Verrucomicrobiae bacterium]